MNKIKTMPTKENTVTKEEQIVFKPLYAKAPYLAKIFGMSRSTVDRILKRWEKEPNGIDEMYVSLSETLKVVEIEQFKAYLRTLNKKWM
ncbi:helix-turn-helix domain-containing protein [Mammaliicoccus sciuri]|uniref:Pathogenicity island protein n=1 Tax=Mammaliicoccus sciuri TaxID=1296 RepID=A0AAI8DHR3_MAMSC|nr:helix-turn-helix domain-containing protein [Mammaliicoccus sciuri]ASE35355.1 pathogenicity island protein [Mammaliicoccus sciuri]